MSVPPNQSRTALRQGLQQYRGAKGIHERMSTNRCQQMGVSQYRWIKWALLGSTPGIHYSSWSICTLYSSKEVRGQSSLSRISRKVLLVGRHEMACGKSIRLFSVALVSHRLHQDSLSEHMPFRSILYTDTEADSV